VSEEIRRALARELHDRVAQTLTTMLIELENFKVEQTGRESALRQLDELQDSTRDVLANLRHVLFELRGESGIEDGLVEAVRTLIARFEERTHVKVELSISPSWPAHLRTQASMNMYRIVDEALTNARLHSGASIVEVALRLARDRHLAIEIKDDGRGADGELGRSPGMGVLGMRERVLILGGILEVETGPGRGTTVRAIIPLEQVI
jgi:signal transduction histidine kinase